MTQNTQEKLNQNPESTQFGTRAVEPDEKTALVRGVFDSVADQYDVMNDVMSGGIHRLWKNHLIRRIRPKAGLHYLDVAGGTGDIAFRIHNKINASGRQAAYGEKINASGRQAAYGEKINASGRQAAYGEKINASGRQTAYGENINTQAKEAHSVPARLSATNITLCDLNWDMLRVGRDRAINQGKINDYDWVTGNAETLPLEDNSVDVYTIAFGLRNVTRIDNALKEAHRVLKSGGRFYCLEFSHVENPALAALYDKFSFDIIPKMGEVIAKDKDSYQYLVESIRKFPTQENLKERLSDAGFTKTSYENLTFGVAAIHFGLKI